MRQLTKKTTPENFESLYFTVAELKTFCRKVNIKIDSHDRKQNITEKIMRFLKTGEIKNSSEKKINIDKINKNHRFLNDKSTLGKGFRLTRETRNYLEQSLDPKFKCTVALLAWVKASPEKTVADLKNQYLSLKKEKDAQKKQKISPQFEYNQFTQDFFKANSKLSRENCLHCWSFVRELTDRKYKKEHLFFLKKKRKN